MSKFNELCESLLNEMNWEWPSGTNIAYNNAVLMLKDGLKLIQNEYEKWYILLPMKNPSGVKAKSINKKTAEKLIKDLKLKKKINRKRTKNKKKRKKLQKQ